MMVARWVWIAAVCVLCLAPFMIDLLWGLT